MACRLTYSEFECMCNELIKFSDAIDDGWRKKNVDIKQGSPVKFIAKNLSKASKCKPVEKETDCLDKYGVIFDDHEHQHDDCEKVVRSSETITFEYHVIYSESYNVPVLYFFASSTNGKSLTLEEIWQRVPQSYKNALEDKWSLITQTEHPYLGCPVFFIHPCNTAKMMNSLLYSEGLAIKRKNYLISWLSAIGPLAGLTIPAKYFQ